MVIAQGEVWWADLDDPIGSEPGFRATLTDRVGKLSEQKLEIVLRGIDVVLGR